jgi:hypothetical protein
MDSRHTGPGHDPTSISSVEKLDEAGRRPANVELLDDLPDLGIEPDTIVKCLAAGRRQ